MKKPILGMAMVAAGLMVVTAAAFAEVPPPATAPTPLPTAIGANLVQVNQADANAPDLNPTGDGNVQYRQFSRGGGMYRMMGEAPQFGGSMMRNGGDRSGGRIHGGGFGIAHAIVATVTLLMVWTILGMLIVLLYRKLKKQNA